jgi:hypothetical protein
MSTPSHPSRLVGGHDLQRSRLTVFFRLILVIPHVIVLAVYAIGVFFAEIIAWFAALFTGRVPLSLHDFIGGYLRYSARVLAYAHILADPFPPFGSGGSYPVDVEVDPPVSQNRLTVFFRGLLALPCLIVLYPLQIALNLVALGNWFVALVTGGVPGGLQSLGMFCLRFQTRTNAYLLLLTPRYPAFGDTPASLPSDQAALPPVP